MIIVAGWIDVDASKRDEYLAARTEGMLNTRQEPGCIEFYKTARSVHSASSEQVRRPIYRAGVDQWRHYEPWLGPLQDALGALDSESARE